MYAGYSPSRDSADQEVVVDVDGGTDDDGNPGQGIHVQLEEARQGWKEGREVLGEWLLL